MPQKVLVSLRLEPIDAKALQAVAEAERRTPSAMARIILSEWLTAWREKQGKGGK